MRIEINQGYGHDDFGYFIEDQGEDGISIGYWQKDGGKKVETAVEITDNDDNTVELLAEGLAQIAAFRKERRRKKDEST